MKAEGRLVWGALRAGALLLIPGTIVGFALRGSGGAFAVAAALAIVVGNLAASGFALMLTAKRPVGGLSAVALPSYAIRMVAVFVAMGAAYSNRHIDHPTFTVAFTAGVVAILVYECLLWARTPWLAIEFGKERS